MTDEFSLISKYFAPFSSKIGDDCAILDLNPGEQLATSVDTLVEGVHFFSDAPPDQVGYRAVVTALSDLAATGAEPRAITLALTLPEATESWLQQFSRGVEQATAEPHCDGQKNEMLVGRFWCDRSQREAGEQSRRDEQGASWKAVDQWTGDDHPGADTEGQCGCEKAQLLEAE